MFRITPAARLISRCGDLSEKNDDKCALAASVIRIV
jgi:hypothetical protein